MKLMLICASEDTLAGVTGIVQPLGFDVIHYRHVLKGMDNIDEVAPSAIIISARDFPRHWKTLAQFVRQQYSRELCPIVVLTGEDFSVEEAAKAHCIGVNGLVSESLTEHDEAPRLQSILNRYTRDRRFDDTRADETYPVGPGSRIGICIANPVNKAIITTTVTAISRRGITFTADAGRLLDNVQEYQELSECSLRAGDAILSPICHRTRGPLTGSPVVRRPEISLEFSYLSGEEQDVLDRYLESMNHS
ncbi:hypothetical protein FACS1894130_05750 [Spirochaetia bacterium]|nr:hypothetical protein FACS1894130_05750 [Spirochaetia bacterium]